MVSFLSVIALGFFLGMRHATDPDHVVAVTTIVARYRSIRHAAWIGALWGVGHTLTILVVGSAIILLGWVIPARIGLSMEFSVGIMLVVLGVMNLTGLMTWINANLTPPTGPGPGLNKDAALPSRADRHSDCLLAHNHGHSPRADSHDPQRKPLSLVDRWFGQIGIYQLVRPLVVGLVHGLAGSAAVALLVLTTIREPQWAVVYLLVFGVGTIAGMMVITSAISLPFAAAGRASERVGSALRVASGLLSVAFGLFVIYQIGAHDGLFGGNPQWTPK